MCVCTFVYKSVFHVLYEVIKKPISQLISQVTLSKAITGETIVEKGDRMERQVVYYSEPYDKSCRGHCSGTSSSYGETKCIAEV